MTRLLMAISKTCKPMPALLAVMLVAVSASRDAGATLLSADDYRFATYGATEGFESHNVQASLHASDGFLWVATEGGLLRYDGHLATPFPLIKNGEPQAVNATVLRERENGELWAVTQHSGIVRLRPGQQSLEPVPRTLIGLGKAAEPPVRNIIFDHAGRLLLAIDFAGVWVSDLSGRPAKNVLSAATETGPDRLITEFAKDPVGTLMVGTGRGEIFDISANPRLVFDEDLTSISALAFDPWGRLWAADAAGKVRVSIDGTVVIDDLAQEAPEMAGLRLVSSIGFHDGVAWLGGSGGVVLVNLQLTAARHIAARPDSMSGIQSELVRNIEIGRNGRNVWVSTFGGGVSAWSSSSVALNPSRIPGAPSALVNAFERLSSGDVLIGTESQGLFIHDQNGSVLPAHNLAQYPELEALENTATTALLLDQEDTLWVGTRFHGLYRYDEDGLTRKRSGLATSSITSIAQTTQGQLYVGMFNGGIAMYNAGAQQFEALDGWDLPHALNSNTRVLSMDPGSNGSLWLSTERNGIFVLDPETKSARQYHAQASPHFRIEADTIFQVKWDEPALWAGTRGKGLLRITFDAQGAIADQKVYGPEQGLPARRLPGRLGRPKPTALRFLHQLAARFIHLPSSLDKQRT